MMRFACNVFFCISLLASTVTATANESAAPEPAEEVSEGKTEASKVLSFQQWKDAQTLDASNRLARTSNQLVVAKGKKAKKSEIQALEKELHRAQTSLELTKEFSIEDYLVAYLMGPEMQKRQDTQAMLRSAAEMMSPEQVAELMRVWMKTLRSQTGSTTPPATSWIRPANSQSWRTP